MKHNIRINGVVKEIDCELGSGYCDDNGNEIFEGDIVKSGCKTYRVEFIRGALCIDCQSLKIFEGNLEIVND